MAALRLLSVKEHMFVGFISTLLSISVVGGLLLGFDHLAGGNWEESTGALQLAASECAVKAHSSERKSCFRERLAKHREAAPSTATLALSVAN